MRKATDLSPLARNLRRLREGRGLSQDRLSKLADVSHNTIIKIEIGAIRSPTVDTAQKIARALGVTLDQLTKEQPSHERNPNRHKMKGDQ